MDDDLDFQEIAPVKTRQQVLEEFSTRGPLVDPDVRSFVSGYVSEVGGISNVDGRYELGDGAHYNLRNIQKFITLHDKKRSEYDVARVLAEQKFVQNDIVEIFALWPTDGSADTVMTETFLVALQILVYLTLPIEVEPDLMTYNHHRHIPYLQLAQIDYKRAILQHASSRILNVAVRAALPAMSEPRRERSLRDETIIKIIVLLMKNVASLVKPSQLPCEIEEAEISRSATIDAFHQQDVFQLLLTMAASMGEDFMDHDVYLLETLFHIIKGVDVEKLFMEEKKLSHENTKEFKTLLGKEKAMLASYARHAPSRHNRFGTMIWVKQDDHKVSTVSGQDVLGSAEKALQKMDTSKKWNKPKRGGRKQEQHPDKKQTEFDRSVPLDSTARKDLRNFIEDFLDSAFNPFFMHLRKTMEREEDRVEHRHFPQYFYVMSWFLKAECVRRRKAKEQREAKNSKSTANVDEENFGLIAGAMTQETFVLLNRYMQRSLDDKSWLELKAGMRAFTQILLTVQEMSESPLEDDQDIAENIQNRIFYEESTHDRIVSILRGYKDQDVGYLDAVTELSHTFLRMLERYSKQNVDLHIRSKRRARKKRKEAAVAEGGEEGWSNDGGEEAEDVADAQKTVNERKFDFNKFAARFVNQSSVSTFVKFLRFYNDLTADQLKRIHRFFYRLAFKMELALLLYRVDIIYLLNKMIKGPEGLDPQQPYFKEWEELIRQVFRRAIKKIEERPELIVEMLFDKIPATTYYLEHGFELEKVTRAPRPPAELEVKPGMEKPEQIGVSVAVLINQSKSDALQWVKDVLSSAIDERKSWEDSNAARKALEAPSALPEATDAEAPRAPPIVIKPDNEERRIALFKDNKLRLLLKLIGCQRIGDADDTNATWIVPSALSAAALEEALELIRKNERDPPTFEEGKSAESFLRSEAAAARSQRKAAFDDDSSGGEGDFEFEAGGPTASRSDALKELKKKRKQQLHASPSEEVDLEEIERRREARRLADYEKRKKIKSALFVHSDDDATDDEADQAFFAREAETRFRASMKIKHAIENPGESALEQTEGTAKKNKRKAKDAAPRSRNKRRKSSSPMDEDSGGEASAQETDADAGASPSRSASPAGSDDNDDAQPSRRRMKQRKPRMVSDDEEEQSEAEATDTPMSSLPQPDDDEGAATKVSAQPSSGNVLSKSDADMPDARAIESEDEDAPVRQAPRRSTVRAGFILDSDSE